MDRDKKKGKKEALKNVGLGCQSCKDCLHIYLGGTKIASQNRSDHGGRKRARNHSAAESQGFSLRRSQKIASR